MQPNTVQLVRYVARVGLPLVCLMGCSASDSEHADPDDVKSTEQAIINGTVPARGALMAFGVVRLGGCTGTLLTNRHVLTAHHCVREHSPDGTWADQPSTGIDVTLEGPDGNQTATQSRLYEPPTPWALDGKDYSIIELDEPMVLNNREDGFFNDIYSGADSSLANKDVLCIGYGGTSEATTTRVAGGFGTLTSARMNITSIGADTYWRARQNVNGVDVVGFGGDSGSTCFLNREITGVQSTCNASWRDVNGNKVEDGWGERYNTSGCTSASAGSFRAWARQQIMADASIAYDFVPALPTIPTIKVAITTPEHVTAADVTGSWTGTQVAPRSTRMDVVPTSEPAFMMCPTISVTAPLEGVAAVRATCFSDALLPVILG